MAKLTGRREVTYPDGSIKDIIYNFIADDKATHSVGIGKDNFDKTEDEQKQIAKQRFLDSQVKNTYTDINETF